MLYTYSFDRVTKVIRNTDKVPYGKYTLNLFDFDIHLFNSTMFYMDHIFNGFNISTPLNSKHNW